MLNTVSLLGGMQIKIMNKQCNPHIKNVGINGEIDNEGWMP